LLFLQLFVLVLNLGLEHSWESVKLGALLEQTVVDLDSQLIKEELVLLDAVELEHSLSNDVVALERFNVLHLTDGPIDISREVRHDFLPDLEVSIEQFGAHLVEDVHEVTLIRIDEVFDILDSPLL
jgi:hypothetical protein